MVSGRTISLSAAAVVAASMTISAADLITTKLGTMARMTVVVTTTSMARRACGGSTIINGMCRRHIRGGRRIGLVWRRSIRRPVRCTIWLRRIRSRSRRLGRCAIKSHSDRRPHHLALWSRTITMGASSTSVAGVVRGLRVRLVVTGPWLGRRTSLRCGGSIRRAVRSLWRG